MISRGTTLLGLGASALNTHRLRSEVASQNIANVSTPGYARQRAVLGAVADPGLGRGAGVEVQTLQALRRQSLHRLQMQASGEEGQAASAIRLLDLGERALVPGAGGDLASSLSAYYGALREASTDPSSSAMRQNVMEQAETLARSVRGTDAALDQAQQSADEEIVGMVDSVNQLSAQIASLNQQVKSLENGGQPALEARTQRQALVDQLSQKIGIDVQEEDGGTLRISMHGGPTLVHDDRVALLNSAPDSANGGLLEAWVDGPVGRARLDSSVGGQLGGLLEARDGTLASLRSQLDQFAYDLASEINAVHQAGVGLDGASGRSLFDVGLNSTGAAARFSVDAMVQGDLDALGFSSSVGSLPGDNKALQNMIAVQEKALFGSGQNTADTLSSMVSQAGSALRTASHSLDRANSRGHQIGALIASTEGVNIEEEILAQAEAQRAFEAAARMIKVADDMFDTVLQLGGR